MHNASDEESQEVRVDCKIEIFLQPVSQQIVTPSQSILRCLITPGGILHTSYPRTCYITYR